MNDQFVAFRYCFVLTGEDILCGGDALVDKETEKLADWLATRHGYWPVRVTEDGQWIYGIAAVLLELDFLTTYYGTRVALTGTACKLAYDYEIAPLTLAEHDFDCRRHDLEPCESPELFRVPTDPFTGSHQPPVCSTV